MDLQTFKETVRDHSPIEKIIAENTQLSLNGRALKGCCPFHADKDPSLSVDPHKGVFYCFGCNIGGDVFSWVMKRENLSFPEALDLLAKRAGLERPNIDPEQRERMERRRRVEEILTLAAEHYHTVLPDEIREMYYRQTYGFTDQTIDELKLGWSDGKLLPYLVKEKGIKAEDVQESGLAVKTQRGLVDFFVGRLVFPYWRVGLAVYMIGRQTKDTPDRPWERGKYKKLKTSNLIQNAYFYGEDAVRGAERILITEGVTDCITAHQAGMLCISPATTRFRNEDHPRLLHLVKDIPEVFICNDAEENRSGDKGAIETAEVLQEAGKAVYLVRLPRPEGVGKVDLCDFLKENSREDFEQLMKQAATLADVLLEQVDPEVQKHWLPNALGPLFEHLAKTDNAAGLLFLNHRVKEYFGLSARDVEALRKTYAEVRKEVEREQLLDTVKPEQDVPVMSEEEETEALAYLENPDLLSQIQKDVARAGGLVGEVNNTKFMYLTATSRLMEKPINVTVFAQSSSGKSHLVNTVSEFIPPEGKLILSSASSRALEYIDEDNLKHRFFVIQELEGAEDVLPTLRVLQSEGRLARLVTIQDPVSNEMKAHADEKVVPCATVMTTTAARLYDENSTRIFEIYVDESVGQTRRVVTHNLRRAGLEYLLRRPERERVKHLHHNVQRLLEPMEVVIPYASKLTFPSETTRNRRDSTRFVQLIKAVAFLYQKQRPIKEAGDIRYAEASVEDYQMAFDIGMDILRRTLDELSDRSRRVLRVIVDLVDNRESSSDDVRFTRKQISDHAQRMGEDFKNTRDLGRHLGQLSALEYVETLEGGKGKTYVYKLKFEGDVNAPMVPDLLHPDELEAQLAGKEAVPF